MDPTLISAHIYDVFYLLSIKLYIKLSIKLYSIGYNDIKLYTKLVVKI